MRRRRRREPCEPESPEPDSKGRTPSGGWLGGTAEQGTTATDARSQPTRPPSEHLPRRRTLPTERGAGLGVLGPLCILVLVPWARREEPARPLTPGGAHAARLGPAPASACRPPARSQESRETPRRPTSPSHRTPGIPMATAPASRATRPEPWPPVSPQPQAPHHKTLVLTVIGPDGVPVFLPHVPLEGAPVLVNGRPGAPPSLAKALECVGQGPRRALWSGDKTGYGPCNVRGPAGARDTAHGRTQPPHPSTERAPPGRRTYPPKRGAALEALAPLHLGPLSPWARMGGRGAMHARHGRPLPRLPPASPLPGSHGRRPDAPDITLTPTPGIPMATGPATRAPAQSPGLQACTAPDARRGACSAPSAGPLPSPCRPPARSKESRETPRRPDITLTPTPRDPRWPQGPRHRPPPPRCHWRGTCPVNGGLGLPPSLAKASSVIGQGPDVHCGRGIEGYGLQSCTAPDARRGACQRASARPLPRLPPRPARSQESRETPRRPDITPHTDPRDPRWPQSLHGPLTPGGAHAARLGGPCLACRPPARSQESRETPRRPDITLTPTPGIPDGHSAIGGAPLSCERGGLGSSESGKASSVLGKAPTCTVVGGIRGVMDLQCARSPARPPDAKAGRMQRALGRPLPRLPPPPARSQESRETPRRPRHHPSHRPQGSPMATGPRHRPPAPRSPCTAPDARRGRMQRASAGPCLACRPPARSQESRETPRRPDITLTPTPRDPPMATEPARPLTPGGAHGSAPRPAPALALPTASPLPRSHGRRPDAPDITPHTDPRESPMATGPAPPATRPEPLASSLSQPQAPPTKTRVLTVIGPLT
uniref:basic proline-rich protein-like n=1 Tax=Jaculus jaculus TaxID=51337 RepID=UPI001E1AF6D6|nr:basic proline-rich protein-like [Jaculus jaculus]